MKEMIIVRHGFPDHMVNALTGGWTDSHLTELGRRQADLTGKRLAGMLAGREFGFFSSDLARAAETARIITQHVAREPYLLAGLREHNNGDAANLTIEQAERLVTPTTRPTLDWVPYPNAESWRQMGLRAWRCLDAIADEADLALIVTHGGVSVPIVHWWLRLGEAAWSQISYQFDLCSVTHLTINDWGERTIRRLNDVTHLAAITEG